MSRSLRSWRHPALLLIVGSSLTLLISPSHGTIYPGGFSVADVLHRYAPRAQVIVRGTATSIDSTWSVPGHLSIYGLFRIEIDQILKGEEFLENTQHVLIMESTGISALDGYPQRPNEYTFNLNDEYVFMISAPCTSGYRKLDFPPFPIDTADSVAVAFAGSTLPWSAFEDTFAIALESSGLNSVSTTADLCATIVVTGINRNPSIAASYTAAFAVQAIHYQPMESMIAPGDTLAVIGTQSGDAPGPAFVAGDTLLVFCQQTASEDWKLVPNVGSALLENDGQFAARATAKRCGCSSCPPYPVAHYTQGAVNNAISVH